MLRILDIRDAIVNDVLTCIRAHEALLGYNTIQNTLY
jgi:hypothetical protein